MDEDWNEYKLLVLSELKDLKKGQEDITLKLDKIALIKTKVDRIDNLIKIVGTIVLVIIGPLLTFAANYYLRHL